MILESCEIELTATIPEGWTVDSVWSGGPDYLNQWQVLLMHQDGTYLVQEVDLDGRNHEVYRSANKDAATEHFLIAVRRLLMEAQGTVYPNGEPAAG